MSEAWIEGCPVQRIMFRDGLVISLGDYNEVVIAVPMWLTLPPAGKWPREIVCVDPKAILDEERPLFSISGSTCTEARWNDAGDLHMEFSDDHVIDVPHHDFDTAWRSMASTTDTWQVCRAARFVWCATTWRRKPGPNPFSSRSNPAPGWFVVTT